MAPLVPFLPLIFTILSIGYQIYQSYQAAAAAKAAKKARDAAEDARKGFESVIEGTSTILPIAYGKAKIGGARVFHGVSGSFNYVAPNADKVMGLYLGGDITPEDETNQYECLLADIIDDLMVSPETGQRTGWVDAPRGPEFDGDVGKWICLLPQFDTFDVEKIDAFKLDYRDTWDNYFRAGSGVTWRAVGGVMHPFLWYYSVKKNTQVPLISTIAGTKNEFLYYQQALCQGPIQAVYDVIIDDSRYLDDPELGCETEIKKDDKGKDKRVKKEAGLRIDCHYGNSPLADSIMGVNFYERTSANFDGMAYVSVVIRLDRDYPQFSAIPNMQFLIEGKKVKDIQGVAPFQTLTDTRAYSNNPALCLLDYLLDPILGKNLDITEVDLESFAKARDICNRVVKTGAQVGGKLYFPTLDRNSGPTAGAATRDIKLYECNLIINPEKTIRENVEELLATMGDARLVWSQGKYKLNMQYPASNAEIVVAATLTDEDFVLDQEVEINWPSASDRMNHCIIKYHNETDNFEEATVSWPPKAAGTFWFGIGGTRYSTQDGFNTDRPCGRLLNDYGVWAQVPQTDTTCAMSWHFYIKETTGVVAMTWAFADAFSLQLHRVTESDGKTPASELIYQNSDTNPFGYSCNDEGRGSYAQYSTGRQLIGGCVYRVNVIAYVGVANSKKGFAALIWDGSDQAKRVFWKTTDPAYSGFYKREVTQANVDAVYNKMLDEDSGLELEKEIFAEGITDYYHALAKAEELVRTSRSATSFKFNAVLKDKYLEPGDFIAINSKALSLSTTGGLYARVNEIKVNEDYTYQISADRFDWTQLAWNVDDDEYIYPPPIYEITLPAPAWLKFTKQDNLEQNTVGFLTWAAVDSPILDAYVFYVNVNSEREESGILKFDWMGESKTQPFYVPFKSGEVLIYGVRARSKTGKLSSMTTTANGGPITPPAPVYPPAVTNLAGARDPTYRKTCNFTWTIPANRDDGTPYNNHGGTTLLRGEAADPTSHNPILSVNASATSCTDNTMLFDVHYYYSVRLFSDRNTYGSPSNVVGPLIDEGGGGGPGQPPGPPTGFKLTPGTTIVFCETDEPLFENYYRTKLYGYMYTATVFDEATQDYIPGIDPHPEWTAVQAKAAGSIASFVGNFGTCPANWNQRVKLWASWVKTYNGGTLESELCDPQVATTPRSPGQSIDDFTGQIKETHLYLFLQERLNLIDGGEALFNSVDARLMFERMMRIDAETIISQQVTLDKFEFLNAQEILEGKLANVISGMDTIISDTQSLAVVVTALGAEFNGNISLIEEKLLTISNENMTTASAVTILQSEFAANLAIINDIKLTYVTADQAMAMITQAMAVGYSNTGSGNLLTDAEMRTDLTDDNPWDYITNGDCGLIKNPASALITNGGEKTIRMQANSAIAVSVYSSLVQDKIPVVPNKWYQFSTYTFSVLMTSSVQLHFLSNANAIIVSTPVSGHAAETNTKTNTGSSSLSDFNRLYGFYQAPSNAAYAKLEIKASAYTAGTSSYSKYVRPYVGTAASNAAGFLIQTEPSDWNPGKTFDAFAGIETTKKVFADNLGAYALTLETLSSRFNTSNAVIYTIKNTYATNAGVGAKITEALAVANGHADAVVYTEKLARIDNAGSLAGTIKILNTRVGSAEGVINTIKTTYATNVGVTAKITESLGAAFGGSPNGNLLTDAEMRTSLSGGTPWTYGESDATLSLNPTPPSALLTNAGETTIQLQANAATSTGYNQLYQTKVPVSPDTWYQASVYAQAADCTATLIVVFYNNATPPVSVGAAAVSPAGTETIVDTEALTAVATALTDYNRIYRFYKTPATAAYAMFYMRGITYTSTTAFSRFVLPYFGTAAQDTAGNRLQTAPSAWVPGKTFDSYAAIETTKTAIVTANSAMASITTDLAAKLGSNAAAIRDEKTARITNAGAIAGTVTSLGVRVGSSEGLIQSIRTTYATNAGVTALIQDQVQAITGGGSANLIIDSTFTSLYPPANVIDQGPVTDPEYWEFATTNAVMTKTPTAYNLKSQSETTATITYTGTGAVMQHCVFYQKDIPVEYGRYYQASVYGISYGCRMRLFVKFKAHNGADPYQATFYGIELESTVVDSKPSATYAYYIDYYTRLFILQQAGSPTMISQNGGTASNPAGVAFYPRFVDLFIGAFDPTITGANARFVRPYFGLLTDDMYTAITSKATIALKRELLATWEPGREVDNYAVIQQRMAVTTTNPLGPLAMYTVKATVAGKTAGFGFTVGAAGSEFIIVADRFSLVDNTPANLVKRFPFIVKSGVVYINKAMIEDATINTAMIESAAITTAKIGTLQVDRINIKDSAVTNINYAYNSTAIAGSDSYMTAWRYVGGFQSYFNLSGNTKGYQLLDFTLLSTGYIWGVRVNILWGGTQHVTFDRWISDEDYVMNPETGDKLYVTKDSISIYNPLKFSIIESFGQNLSGDAYFTFDVSVLVREGLAAWSTKIIAKVLSK